MIPLYDIKEQWIGTNDQTDYTFDFKIQDPKFLLIVIQDNNGLEVERFRGDDTGLLASVIFDPIRGGGTISLLSILQTEYVLTAFLANDYPTQPSTFANMQSFTLQKFEMALDFIVGALQRVAFRVHRSVRMYDLDDLDLFDPTLPPNLPGSPGGIFSIKQDGTGFEIIVTAADVLAAIEAVAEAQTAAATAVAAATNANASASAAETAAAEAIAAAANSGYLLTGPYSLANNSGPVSLSGHAYDHALVSSVEFKYEIVRGNLVFTNGEFVIQYKNGNWKLVPGTQLGDVSGATFNVLAGGQLQVALDNNGAGDGVLKLKEIQYAT